MGDGLKTLAYGFNFDIVGTDKGVIY